MQEFSKLGGKEISITGGEPLERGLDFITKLIRFCKDLGLYVIARSILYLLQSLIRAKACNFVL